LKQVWINQLQPGQDICENFVLRKIEVKEYNGRKYLSLEFGDKTGRINGVCWEGAEEYIPNISAGNILSVRGAVITYKDMPQVNVASMQPVKPDDYDPADFLPSGPCEPQKVMAQIDEIIEVVRDVHYKNLLNRIFSDEKFRRKFSIAPAAKLWHHSYIGGLAEHTLNVARLCQMACKIYNDLDENLLTVGALLHDIGKADTYSMDNFFDYTDNGRLIGHTIIADRIISDMISGLDEFPAEKAKLIRHLVLSHHGTYEQASPVLPQTLEANVLHIIDLLDSRVGGIMKVKGKLRKPGQRWSNYVKLLERFIYFKDE